MRTVWSWIKDNYERLWELEGSTLRTLGPLQDRVPICVVEDEAYAIEFFSGERMSRGVFSFKQTLEILHAYSGLRRRLGSG